MIEEQPLYVIQKEELVAKVEQASKDGFRLVQVSAVTKPDMYEVSYSFDKNYSFMNYRILLPKDSAELPSISGIYWAAFLYENELHDLFDIQVHGINIDFKGKFYSTSVPTPFKNCAVESAK